MTDKTTPLENPAKEPAPAPALAPGPGLTVESTVANQPGRPRDWWILSSGAGMALLVIGLLGGILIGQNMHPPGQQERTAHVFIERGQAGQLDRLPQRLKERFQQRQDTRQGQRNQQQPTPQPSEPSTGDNG